jgi:hypothetical protein
LKTNYVAWRNNYKLSGRVEATNNSTVQD